MLKEFRIAPQSGGKAKQAVIFLHGVGDRGDGGLLDIGDAWKWGLQDCEFLCPDAPFPFDMAPADLGGRQWFSMRGITSFTDETLYDGVRIARHYLDQYIDHVLETRGIKPAQLALFGFSQGAIMSLYVAPRRAEPVASVVAHSGLLVGAKKLAAEKKCAPPVLLIHGMKDDVVPYARMGEAEQELKDAGIPVTTLTRPETSHWVDDTAREEAYKFVKAHFS